MKSPISRQLFDMPDSIAALPRDHRGFPVPAFATWKDGVPDFVRVDPRFFARCVNEGICWVCGGKLGKRLFFVTGPMCTVTRTSSEPPVHMGCAKFSVRNCPFLTRPLAKRADMTGKDYTDPGGVMIERNPGVTAIWESRGYKIIRDANDNPLIRMGEPVDLQFWTQGRPATKDEALKSANDGFPALFEMAESEGPIAIHDLEALLGEWRFKIMDKFYPPTLQGKHRGS